MTTSGCSIRGLWILNPQDAVVFSRRFAAVERRGRAAWEAEEGCERLQMPVDAEVAEAYAERKRREGSARGFGIRTCSSSPGSDSWIDDPITRHIITLHINKEEGNEFMLWPLILHRKGGYDVLVLPLVDPQQFKAYERLCKRSDCGSSATEKDNLSSILLNLPCITG